MPPDIQEEECDADTRTKTKDEEKITGSVKQLSFPIIVIGASLGGMEALRKLVAGLPPDLGASLFIVWHMAPDVRGMLPDILNKESKLPVSNAYDGEIIQPNHIYVAPPDHHLLVEEGKLCTSRGPKENRFRPAVDPLFRSAAYVYGSNVIGIILTGGLDDGTAGLLSIKNNGGMTVVQDPKDAEAPSMPESALRHVDIDYCVSVADMPHLLVNLVKEINTNPVNTVMKKDENVKTEISIAAADISLNTSVMQLGELSPFTCPECHGVLTAITEGSLRRYRCHTGHAYSVDSLLSALTENIEDNLWTAIRSMKESMLLLNHIGDHFADINNTELASVYFTKALDVQHRADAVREVVMHHEQLSKEGILQKAEAGTAE